MRRSGGDKLLNWGFATALTLHGVALAGAACLPVHVAKDEFGEIRVFDAAAPALMVPVDLVEWPAQAAAEPIVEIGEPAEAVSPRPRPEPAPAQHPTPEPAPKEQPPAPKPAPTPTAAEPPAAEPQPAVRPTQDEGEPGGGGGGGGGFVNLGTPSPNGELEGAGSGGTPVGDVPGSGSGSGVGVGPGSEGGSGGGSGGGTGTGQGTGEGPGAGSGTGGGTGSGGPGFVSRVADRKEPVVVLKGTLEYPPSAVAEGSEGTVRLKVLVSEVGTVAEVMVVESSRDRRLDGAALEFVRGWRYRPAVQDGKPRSVYTHAVVTFELK